MDSTLKMPQHRRLYEILRKNIQEGVYEEGNLLPSENELCTIHQVTRPTVRQALAALVNDGFIQKHQGKGSIVNSLPKGIGILSIQGTSSSFLQKELETRMIEKPSVQAWPEHFMFELSELEQTAGCVVLTRQRIVQEKPILYEYTYLPYLNLERFTSRSFENRSLFDLLRIHYQIEIRGGEQKIQAIGANEELSRYLKVKKNHPVLHLQRKMRTNRPDYHVYSSIFCDTERFYLHGLF